MTDETKGVSSIDYALLVALIGLAIVASLIQMRVNMDAQYKSIATMILASNNRLTNLPGNDNTSDGNTPPDASIQPIGSGTGSPSSPGLPPVSGLKPIGDGNKKPLPTVGNTASPPKKPTSPSGTTPAGLPPGMTVNPLM